MAEHKDKIKGGLADKKKPSNFDPKALAEGLKVEMEHTSDRSVAQEIAMDHLTEDKNYYKKLKEVEKKDMIEVTPDGKQEIVEGKEPLKKDPKLKDRWGKLKKGLNNLNSIIDLESAMQPDEQPEEEQAAQPDQPEENPEDMGQQVDENQENPEQEQTDESDEQVDEQDEDMDEQDAEMPDESDEEASDEDQFDEDSHENELIQSLKDEGYSEPEIAYIVHGHHSPAYDESNEAKADATRAMADVDVDSARQSAEADLQAKMKQAELEHQHAQRMKDLEFQHAQMQTPDPETEKNHKKRMLDLEYENARAQSVDPEVNKKMAEMDVKERELQLKLKEEQIKMELEFRKKEHELKLKMMEQNMKQQASYKAEQAEMKHKEKMSAKPEKDQKKKLKKSFDIENGIEVDDE